MHSTWSRRQLVHGEPFSTTSQRTLRARQQQQALDARRFTGRLWAERPAAEAFRFPDSDSVIVTVALALLMVLKISGGERRTFDHESLRCQAKRRKGKERVWSGEILGEVKTGGGVSAQGPGVRLVLSMAVQKTQGGIPPGETSRKTSRNRLIPPIHKQRTNGPGMAWRMLSLFGRGIPIRLFPAVMIG